MNKFQKLIARFLIPNGIYCYGPNGRCPFWSRDSLKDEQENGYCSYLGKGDWDINDESEFIEVNVLNAATNVVEKKIIGKKDPKYFGSGFASVSLLWDKCKQCNVKYRL